MGSEEVKPLFRLITCKDPFYQSHFYHLCKSVLYTYEFPFPEEVNVDAVMTLTRGKANPEWGFVVLGKDDEYVGTDVFDLCYYIEKSGFRYAC